MGRLLPIVEQTTIYLTFAKECVLAGDLFSLAFSSFIQVLCCPLFRDLFCYSKDLNTIKNYLAAACGTHREIVSGNLLLKWHTLPLLQYSHISGLE